MLDLLASLQAGLADRYRLEREVGRGGMATVYLAHDLKHDREVALKVLRPELTAILGRERFLNEIRLTAKLDHPHILTLIDSGETDGLLWYVLPFIRGESLRQRLERERQLRLDEALAITSQIAGALDYAHGHGIIHRDIKPENILLHEGEAMLADFGIALAVKEAGGSRITETGLSLGTPAYMSPEQATGERSLDARSDVYSLGAVLYEMLAAEPPHTGATAHAVIAKLMTERPTPLRIVRDMVPEAVELAVARALAKVPADRFASAGEFAAQLTAVARSRSSRRRPQLWAGGVVVGLVLTALAVLAVFHRRAGVPGVPVKMTSSGDITAAALSRDGTRLAKSVRECDSGDRCSFVLVWQDLGGPGELRLVDRLGSVRSIEWSPDARQLVFQGSDSTGRYGAFRVGALGGPVQFLGCCQINFLTTGDTVLLLGTEPLRGQFLRVITPVDGTIHDSVGQGRREQGSFARPSPDGKLIVEFTQGIDSSRLVTIDRRWKRIDSITVSRKYQGAPAWDPRGDAVFLKTVASEGSTLARLERVPVNDRGRLGLPKAIGGLTVPELTAFSIVGPRRTLLYVQGGEEWTVQALTRNNARSLDFKSRLLRRSTGDLGATLSPDGRLLDIFSRPAESPRMQVAILPFQGGAEIPLPRSGADLVEVSWARNSSRLFYTERDARNRVTLYSFDVQSARARTVGAGPIRPGWEVVADNLLSWIDDSTGSIVLADTNGVELRRFPDPDRSERSGSVTGSPDGNSLLTSRWSAGLDSLLFTKVDLRDGLRRRIAGLRAEGPAGVLWAKDGTIQVAILETLGSVAFYRLDAHGGPPLRLGSYPAEGMLYFTFSTDGGRAVKVETRPRGDVWMVRNFDGRAPAQ
jgi:dipeptidyl aminopeptidase/acylaminoacyl peptidase